eukprot:403374292
MQCFTFKNWHFLKQQFGTILNSSQTQHIHHYYDLQSTPDMIYGFNRLLIVNAENDFVYDVNPFDALKQNEDAPPVSASPNNQEYQNQIDLLNSINLKPKIIEVQESSLWKSKDLSKVKDLKNLDSVFDWSFSTPYKGTIRSLSKSLTTCQGNTDNEVEELKCPQKHDQKLSVYDQELSEQIDGLQTYIKSVVGDEFDIQASEFKAKLDYKSFTEIPLGKLGQDNPILHFAEVVLFEDELGDKGHSKVNVKFRVMNDCFFLLLRSYTRVDHVTVRILDTRLYHEFGTDRIIRDFTHKESSYEELKQKDFDTSSKWSMTPHQSDTVYPYLDDKMHINDQIIL